MVTSLLAATLALSAKSDFEHSGAPVSRVVEAMGEAYGVQATADLTLKKDYVIVALHGETFASARDLFAKAINAEWEQRNGKWVLHRTHKQELDEQRAERADAIARNKEYQESIKVPGRLTGKTADEYIQKLVLWSADKDYGLDVEMTANTPLQRALLRIAKEFDVALLADLSASSWTAFSGHDSLAFRRMPQNVLAIVREAIEDQNALNDRIVQRAASIPDYYQLERLVFNPDRIVVFVQPLLYGCSFELNVPTASGGELHTQQTFTDTSFVIPPFDLPESLEVSLVQSEVAKEMAALRPPKFYAGVQRRSTSRELMEVFLDHKHHDYLELSPSEIVMQAARAEGKSYVVVGSELASGTRLSLRSHWTVRTALPEVFRPGLYSMERTESAVFLRPFAPANERRDRIDREKFASALKAYANGSGSIDVLADAAKDLSAAGASRMLNRLSYLTRAYIQRTGTDSMALLVLYASLGGGHRSAAAADGLVLESRSLHGPSGDLLKSLLIEKARNGISGYGDPTSLSEQSYEGLRSNAREIQRFVGNARVVLRKSKAAHIYQLALNENGSALPYLSSPEAAAGFERFPTSAPERVQYRLVDQEMLQLSLLTPGGEIPVALFLAPSIYEGDAFEPIEKMPKWVRDRYDAELKRLRGG